MVQLPPFPIQIYLSMAGETASTSFSSLKCPNYLPNKRFPFSFTVQLPFIFSISEGTKPSDVALDRGAIFSVSSPLESLERWVILSIETEGDEGCDKNSAFLLLTVTDSGHVIDQ